MIKLRALEREDLKQLRDWRNDPEIFSRVREYRLLNMENQETWFNSLRDNRQTIMFGVEIEEVSAEWVLVGVCGLTNIDWTSRKAEVSIYIGDKSYRGRGLGVKILDALAKYAFEECNLRKLWAEVYQDNGPSIILFDKVGYSLEGRLKNHVYKNGKYQDSRIYGLLREEWEEGVAPSA